MPHPCPTTPDPRLTAAVAVLVAAAAISGCAAAHQMSTTLPPQTGSRAASGPAGTLPSAGAASTSSNTDLPGTSPVAPSCPRPGTATSSLALARFADPAPAATGDRSLQPGTDHSVAASAWAYPAAQVQRWITHPATGQPAHKIAFITFDDGPTSNITPRELDNLEATAVHATFFQIGRQVASVAPSLEERIIADGDAVGVHSYSHDYHYLYPHRIADAAHIACDYQWGRYAIARSLGAGYNGDVSRYPGGHMSWKNMTPADQALATLGDTWIDWNALSGDAEPPASRPRTVAAMVDSVDSQAARSRGNVLVILDHDAADKDLTARAMPDIIADLKRRGYTFGIIA